MGFFWGFCWGFFVGFLGEGFCVLFNCCYCCFCGGGVGGRAGLLFQKLISNKILPVLITFLPRSLRRALSLNRLQVRCNMWRSQKLSVVTALWFFFFPWGWTWRGQHGAEGSGSGRAAPLRSGLAGPGPLPLLAEGLAAPPCRELIDGPFGRWLPSGRAESDSQPYIFFLHLKNHPSIPPQNMQTWSLREEIREGSQFFFVDVLVGFVTFRFFPCSLPLCYKGWASRVKHVNGEGT